jgi:spermidine synthase
MIVRRTWCVLLLAIFACCTTAAAEEKIIFQKQSPFSLVVVTEDDQGMRTLRFGTSGVRQSVAKVGDPDHLELSYAPVMLSGLAIWGGNGDAGAVTGTLMTY